MIITRSRPFKRKIKRLPKSIQLAFMARLELFIEHQYDIRLNNHALSGPLCNYRSINITGDYRLVYEQYDENTIRLIDIDTHSHLYDH
ncbi:MAG: type II toxin-antitoxin system mRNA interferase toxin, RelE/StbE family [Patescibacteria group bacterium]